MKQFDPMEVWFVTGSQGLYGEDTLKLVAEDSQKVAEGLNRSDKIPVRVVYKPVVTSSDAIERVCLDANSDPNCIGLITWMHTFSPAKMWIRGLSALRKPFLHLHTQFNVEIPWSGIDMDFMNLNQSAHGGREFGFIATRLRKNRKIVVGHWQDPDVQSEVAVWARAAAGWNELRHTTIARFGDNMNEVAVTDGDKVEAQIRLGFSVRNYGIGDLVAYMDKVTDAEIDKLVASYDDRYVVAETLRKGGSQREALRYAAKIEIGLRAFLEDGGFKGFTTNFETLHGMEQLPGLAVQRLMADGYGFGAEGDWKTAALVRAMKVMAAGLDGGTSFMEDYTYHLKPGDMKVLGAHMLEVCESIADGKPSLEIHPLSIGGKSDPVRLVFNVPSGPAVNATLIDMGTRFRLIVNEIQVVSPDAPLPKLPVARAVWVPKPDLRTGAAAWILAGGAHHFGFSQAIGAQYLEDLAEMADVEFVLIGSNTTLSELKKELRWNQVYYHLEKGL